MRKFLIKVNGHSYEVEVEEMTGAQSAPVSSAVPASAPVYEPAMAPAPTPEPPVPPKNLQAPAGATEIKSPLPGTILSVNVSVGDKVTEGDVLVMIEAMKMENEIMSPRDGTVLSIAATKDSIVNTGDLLLIIG